MYILGNISSDFTVEEHLMQNQNKLIQNIKLLGETDRVQFMETDREQFRETDSDQFRETDREQFMETDREQKVEM